MPREAVEKLSGKQELALETLWQRTAPGGAWLMTGYLRIRENTLSSLERRGLCEYRALLYAGTIRWEYRITEKGVAWVERRHDSE